MAHHKRGYSRTKKRGRHSMATVSYRKRHGLKPYRVPVSPKRDQYETAFEYWQATQRWYESLTHLWWGTEFNMMSGSPRDWDILHHVRPHRRRSNKLLRNIMLGKIDPENAAWPLPHKPHIYYW